MGSRIVVTGIGVITALGSDRRQFEQRLFAGRGGIASHAGIFPDRKIYAGLVMAAIPSTQPPAEDSLAVDRTAQLAIMAAAEALADAGLTPTSDAWPAAARLGLVVGTSHGGRSQLDRFVEAGADAVTPANARRFLETACHYYQTACLASYLDIHGPVITISTACSSSGVAIAYGYELLQADKVDVVITGGADAFSKLTYVGFGALGALAERDCGPFSQTMGINLGEGGAFVVLERLERALARRAQIHGELFTYATSWDAHHLTAPEPSGDGIWRALELALSRAGGSAFEIDYINAHGTGTRANDVAETLGIKRLFGRLASPPVSSTKSATGHTLGAAAGIGLITCLAAAWHEQLPPTLNFSAPRPGCDLDYVPNVPRPARVDRFLVDASGFGGVNCVLYGGRYHPGQPEARADQEDAVVITGIGVVSALGYSWEEVLEGLRAGRSGVRPIDRFDVSGLRASHAALLRDFNPRRLLPSVNLRRIDGVTQYATIAASQALEQARLPPRRRRPERVGLVVGTTRGAIGSFESYLASVQDSHWDQASAIYFPNLVMSSIGGNISTALGIKGLASTVVGGIGAGLQALLNGFEWLRRDTDYDAVVVVAADEITPLYFRLYDCLGRLAGDVVLPYLYQADSPGMVLGEGAVALVLERARVAHSRAVQPLATIAGYGSTNDATPERVAETSGRWLKEAARQALDEARVPVTALDLVFGMGTGMAAHDLREGHSLEQLLTGSTPAVGCVNGNLGLAEACSGLFAVLAAVGGLYHGETYPLVSAGRPYAGLPWVRWPQRGNYRHALVVGSSEQGNNTAVVLRRSEWEEPL